MITSLIIGLIQKSRDKPTTLFPFYKRLKQLSLSTYDSACEYKVDIFSESPQGEQ